LHFSKHSITKSKPLMLPGSRTISYSERLESMKSLGSGLVTIYLITNDLRKVGGEPPFLQIFKSPVLNFPVVEGIPFALQTNQPASAHDRCRLGCSRR
jgi:hypothetical protein